MNRCVPAPVGFLAVMLINACGDAPSGDLGSVRMLPEIAAAGSAEPHLARTPDGTVVMSWLEPHSAGVALKFSTLRNDLWNEPRSVAHGEDWFVNWADFPSVVPITETVWAAHWLTRTAGGVYAYNVTLAISNDAGNSWSQPLTPHDDGTATEHGFVSLFPWAGAVGALWLDGRNMASDAHGEAHAGGMTLRSAVIGNDGAIGDPRIVDELVCDCCQTDVAIGRNGPIAVYRNRSVDEIRDIHVVRSGETGWLPDQPVVDDGWKIAACPVNGPAIDRFGAAVAVTWFTAAAGDSRVRMAWSRDDGANFGAAMDIDIDRPIGRVDIELLDERTAVVSWLRTGEDDTAEISLRHVTASGSVGPLLTIARTGASRSSGFPQMLREDDDLVLAWTDTSDEQPRVVTARVAVSAVLGERRGSGGP